MIDTFDNTINHVSKTTEVILQSLIKVTITSYLSGSKSIHFNELHKCKI